MSSKSKFSNRDMALVQFLPAAAEDPEEGPSPDSPQAGFRRAPVVRLVALAAALALAVTMLGLLALAGAAGFARQPAAAQHMTNVVRLADTPDEEKVQDQVHDIPAVGVPCEAPPPCGKGTLNEDCEAEMLSWGTPSLCRHDKLDSTIDGQGGTEIFKLPEAECVAKCVADGRCKGVEYRASDDRCEIWTVPVCHHAKTSGLVPDDFTCRVKAAAAEEAAFASEDGCQPHVYAVQAGNYAPRRFQVGTSNCNGVHECQFKSLPEAQHFCDCHPSCTAVLLHPSRDGGDCASELGCFSPRGGPITGEAGWQLAGGVAYVKE